MFNIFSVKYLQKNLKLQEIIHLWIKYRELISEQVAKEFNLIDKAALDTIRIKPAITSIFTSHDDKGFYQYLPIGMVVTGAARTSGLSKENVRVITEIKVTDSVSGQVLAKAIDLKAGKEMQNKESEVVLSDVEPVLEQWAQRLFNVLSGLKHQE